MTLASLADLLHDGARREPPLQPAVPLPATFAEQPVIVVSLLERTAVFTYLGDSDHERQLARFDRLDVDPRLFRAQKRWEPAKNRSAEPGIRQIWDPHSAGRGRERGMGYRHRSSNKVAEGLRRNRELALRGKRWCSRKNHEVAADDFGATRGWCRACYNEYHRAKNAEYQREKTAAARRQRKQADATAA